MDTIKIEKKNVKLIAHSGGGMETENSIASFISSGNRSYFGIETDTHVTADKKFVIMHDDNTLRFTGTDMVIEESNFDDLRKLKLYDLDMKSRRGDLCIPALAEYISICKKYEKVAVLELKNEMLSEDIERAIDEIRKLDYLENVIFISFSWENVITLRKLLPEQKIQFLVEDIDDELVERLEKERLDIDIVFFKMTEEWVKKLHEKGIEINCWTVDEVEWAEKLISWGVDYITTNILE